jgi:hypothetical protein
MGGTRTGEESAVTEEQYQAELAKLKRDWGRVSVDPYQPSILRATNDPFAGLLAGIRAPLFAEILNRAMEAAHD